jgi:hypothetical protein
VAASSLGEGVAGVREGLFILAILAAGFLWMGGVPPREGLSQADRIVWDALAAAEGSESVSEYTARYWVAVNAGLRRYIRERAS